MKKFRLFILGLGMFVLMANQAKADDMQTQKDIETIRSRAITMMCGLGVDQPGKYMQKAIADLNERGKKIMSTPLPDMTKVDLDEDLVEYFFNDHFNNLRILAQCYRAPGGDLEGSAKVKAKLEQGLEKGLPFVSPGAPEPGNWHPWLIVQPRALGTIGLVMGDDLRQDLREQLIAALQDQLKEMLLTGANAAWEARNHLYLALMTNDVDRINAAAQKAFASIYFSADDGVGEDYSHMFHGKIIYTGGYGSGYAETNAEFMYLLDNTRWAASDEKKDVITKFIIHHAQWVVIHGHFDLSVRGRGYMDSRHATGIAQASLYMSYVDNPLHNQMIEAAKRMLAEGSDGGLPVAALADKLGDEQVKQLNGFRYYYTADLAVFRQPGFYVSLRQYSTRTQDYEFLTKKGGEGWNLSNGLTHITRTGKEWWTPDDDRPIKYADFDRLPGTTSRFGANPINEKIHFADRGYSLNFGRSGFSGGAGFEDGGMAGFILIPTYGDFTANKSYFFFDQGFVALGSAINATGYAKGDINTTVAQWASDTDELEMSGKEGNEQGLYTDVKWIHHDGIGYVFLEPAKVQVKRDKRMTTIWINHGQQPHDAGYAYIVLPDMNLEQTKAFAKDMPVHIEAKSSLLHAVEYRGKRGMVFFSAGRHGDLTVNHPAVIYHANGVAAIQNPLHTEAKLILSHGLTGKEQAIAVDTAMGRIYCIDANGKRLTDKEPPREDLLTFKKFKVDAASDPKTTVLRVHLPVDLGDQPYRLIIHGHKGHTIYELTEADLIDRPNAHTARYRWERKFEHERPEMQLSGSFRFSLRTETRYTKAYFSVPAYDEDGNVVEAPEEFWDSNRPPWTY